MDITYKTDEGRFNYRVCAVKINVNNLLAMHNELVELGGLGYGTKL